MSEWQDIATAPKDGTEILVYDGIGMYVARWADCWVVWEENMIGDLTHWMLLPDEPE